MSELRKFSKTKNQRHGRRAFLPQAAAWLLCLSLLITTPSLLGGCSLFDRFRGEETERTSEEASFSEAAAEKTAASEESTASLEETEAETSPSENLETTRETHRSERTESETAAPLETTAAEVLVTTEAAEKTEETTLPASPAGESEAEATSPATSTSAPAPTPSPVPTTEAVSDEIHFEINIQELVDHPESLRDEQLIGVLDASGYIYRSDHVELTEDDTVLSVLERVAQSNNIQIDVETSFLGAYVAGIHYLYEKAAGPNSGWTYEVNGVQVQRSADNCPLEAGDNVVWRYIIGD